MRGGDGVAPLRVGDLTPDFVTRNHHGQELRLSGFRGRRVALVFYPWAFSSICTSELTELRDAWPRLAELGLEVLAVSCDPMFSLRAYADAERLPFELLTDWWPHGRIAADYGVFDAELGCALRGTFIVGPDGVLEHASVTAVGERRDLLAILA